MRVYRIAAASFAKTRREAFSGKGGLIAPARWHTTGHLIVYTAQYLSLAALEILVHLKQTDNVQPFCVYSAEIPNAAILRSEALPPQWRKRIAVSRRFGDTWLESKTSPALLVPSIVTPGECNVLLNPTHPHFSLQWVMTGPTPYTFDPRFFAIKNKTRSLRG